MLKTKSNVNTIISSARRYLRFGNPVDKRHAAALWTFKKLGIKDYENLDKKLQELWIEGLGQEPELYLSDANQKNLLIDQIITQYFLYLDIKNYKVEKLVDRLKQDGIISNVKPGLIDSLGRKELYSSLMLAYPLPWSLLAEALKASDNELPERFLRLVDLVDSLEPFIRDQAVDLESVSDLQNLILKLEEVSISSRSKHKTPLPEKMIVLVEGSTEHIALPHLAKILGRDFNQLGIMVITVGGKNQMLKQYKAWSEDSNLPVRVILDADAKEQIAIIQELRRDEDKLFVIPEGEFEDSFELEVLVDLLNEMLGLSDKPVNIDEFDPEMRRTENLNIIWRARGLGDFDKVAFANTILDCLDSESQIPNSFKEIILAL